MRRGRDDVVTIPQQPMAMDASAYATSHATRKPRLRGVSHQAAFFAAVGAGAVLVAIAASRGRAGIALVYALSLSTMFGVSALYHRHNWQPRAYALMRRLDHSAIFLLIAGTYTPFCLLGVDRAQGMWLLAIVWSGAIVGIVQKLVWPDTPRWLSAAPYVALGWVAAAALPYVTPRMSAVVMGLIVAGGVAYTLGALVYATRRPNPTPLVFGYHEIFHALVIVAAVLHFAAVSILILG